MDRHQASYVMTTHVMLDLICSCWALLDGDAGWKGIETGMIAMPWIYIGQSYMPVFPETKPISSFARALGDRGALSGGD